MTNRHRTVLGLVAVLVLGVSGPPVAAGTKAAKPVELAGTTIVRASETSHQLVNLRKDAVVRFDAIGRASYPGYQLSGKGQLRGLILLSTTRGQNGLPERMLWLLGGGMCMKRGCTPIDGGSIYQWSRGLPHVVKDGGKYHRVTITRGTYQLYAITDGAPITATLRLSGLSGRTTFTPSLRLPIAAPMTPLQTDPVSPPNGRWELTHYDRWEKGPFLAIATLYTHLINHFSVQWCADKPERTDGGVAADCPVSRDPRAVVANPDRDDLILMATESGGGAGASSFTAWLWITSPTSSFRAQIKAQVAGAPGSGFTAAFLFVPLF